MQLGTQNYNNVLRAAEGSVLQTYWTTVVVCDPREQDEAQYRKQQHVNGQDQQDIKDLHNLAWSTVLQIVTGKKIQTLTAVLAMLLVTRLTLRSLSMSKAGRSNRAGYGKPVAWETVPLMNSIRIVNTLIRVHPRRKNSDFP
jgi:hypothetical protein